MKTSILGAVAAAILLATQQSFALGFGEAVLTSDMSSPLHLSVPVVGLDGSGIDPESLRVDVPGYLDQVALGISDPVLPRGLKTVLVADGRGGVIVRMTTRTAVREPALRFALRARWSGGNTVRTYELIVDPPFVARPRIPMQAPVVVSPVNPRIRVTVAPPAPAARAGTSYGPVTVRDTLYEIALAAYPRLAGRLSRVMAVIVERNPNAFVGGDVDRLLRDTSVALPATSVMVAAVAAPSPSPATTMHSVPGSTYIVVESDTIYGIARRVLAVAEVQLPGAAKRIHERNPQAFDGGDINRLRVGAVLQLGATPVVRAHAAAVDSVAVAPTVASSPITAAQPALVDATVPALVKQLAAARQAVADKQQAQSDLRVRLDALARELQDLRVRSERLNAQSEALIGELQLDKADVTLSTQIAESASAGSGDSIPAAATVTSAPPSAMAPAAGVSRAPRPAPETGVLSFLGTVLPSGPTFWISAAVLILALLMATIAVVRRWWMVRDMQLRVRADEGAVRRKLEEVRKHHETGAFVAQPLQAPGVENDTDSLHLTDAAHAVRFAREAAVNLAYGNFDVARTCIEEAIRLDPHRDEHKMVLVTVFENTGEHILAREIIDELLNRRDQLPGDLRKQVEQMKRRSTD